MDVERMIAGLQELDRGELVRLEEALRRRFREFGKEETGETTLSGVTEYRPHEDGYLQAEFRRYVRKDGSVKEQGPYWYFRHHEDGKQKKLYLGKTDDPEEELARKRAMGSGAA